MATSFPEIGDGLAELTAAATHRLDADEFARAAAYGTQEQVTAGQVLADLGDANVDLILAGTATLEALRTPAAEAGADVFLRYGPGQYAGELNLLTGQTRALAVRVARAGTVVRVGPQGLRQLMARENQLSDVLLRSFLARRRLLRDSDDQDLRLIGDPDSGSGLALRTFLGRQGAPYRWIDPATADGQREMAAAGLGPQDLPAAVTTRDTLRAVTPGSLGQQLGLTYRNTGRAVNDLTARAAVQALKFGASIATPCGVRTLEHDGELHTITLVDGSVVRARAVVVATGAAYRALPLPRWSDFIGSGIYYAATDLEVQPMAGREVTVVGGANSAGQAALHLARYGARVTLVVRAGELGAGMSAYLVDRILAEPAITVRTGSEVSALHGGERLDAVTVTARRDGGAVQLDCSGLFCFIGAVPATGWLRGVALDPDGFVRTDVQLTAADLDDRWAAVATGPLPFETSVPGVFAAGDVRLGSMKRVAAAAGEGASAVRSVHQALAR